MSSSVCPNCGCTDIDKDPARGDAVCTGCGSVLEDQIIVSEVQFQENAAGGAAVIGQYVSAEGPKGHNMGAGFHHGLGKESRAITLQNGKRRIQQLGDQLRLNQHCIDTAYNFFKMAVNRRLTRGRKNTHIIAACLYLTCRTEGTSHMLLDFSDVLQVNVYALGRTYLQLSRELCINVPALDPCLYIHRFAHKLEFGEKTHEVSMTALRLVSRMKRDWMAQGRRPSGLCGAALLVAARIHDFNRKIKEIIKVVKIGEATVRKRLAEFEATPSSQLTIDEFQRIDLEEEMDPPCFMEGRRKAKLAQLEDQGQLPALTTEIDKLRDEIDQALEDILQRKHRRYKDVDSTSICSTTPSVADLEDEDSTCSKFLQSESMKGVLENSSSPPPLDINDDAKSLSEVDGVTNSIEPVIEGADDPDVHSLEKAEFESVLSAQDCGPSLGPRPTAASLGIKESIDECMRTAPSSPMVDEDGELDLTDINDDELDRYILTDREVQMKTRIWMAANEDYLRELKEKQEREAQLAKEGAGKQDQKKKKRARRRAKGGEAHSAGEAIEKMLQEKKISSKINYDVLRNLNQAPEPKKVEPEEAKPSSVATSVPLLGEGPITATPISIQERGFKRPLDMKSLKSDQVCSSKKERLEPAYHSQPTPIPEVVVESGPVDYQVSEDEGDLEEEDEDDEGHISAAQLMGHSAVEEDYGDYDDDY